MTRKKVDNQASRRIRAIMATRDGRAWMWELLSGCGVYRSSFAQNALSTAFAEGGRNVGLKVLAELNEYAFDLTQLMEQEAREPTNDDEVATDVPEDD